MSARATESIDLQATKAEQCIGQDSATQTPSTTTIKTKITTG